MLWSDFAPRLVTRSTPDLVAAYVAMALNAAAYLPAEQYAVRLRAALGATSVTRLGGQSDFVPFMLIVRGPTSTIVAFSGTRNWVQWATHATEAGWSDWPTGPGQVYGSFLLLHQLLRPEWVVMMGSADNLILTGHSLGAGIAALCARQAQDVGREIKSVHVFGSPRIVDARWVQNYQVKTWCLNHPLDFVPYAPLDSIGILLNPYQWARSNPGFVSTGTAWTLPAWMGAEPNGSGLTAATAFAAAAAAPRHSHHQTFRYLLDLRVEQSAADRELCQELHELMADLGLYNPWPE